MIILPAAFDDTLSSITYKLLLADEVEVGEWQAIQNSEMPQSKTLEVEDISFSMAIPLGVETLQAVVQPNLPWAEDHFQERISGIPYNPPPSHEWWPFAQKSNAQHLSQEKFSHTYPERMWPKWAGNHVQGAEGIRYPWGDLSDLVELLKTRPSTRQAYLPIWFPEDTGAVSGQRVPCTLGYHFLIRQGCLKIVYYIRSCDFYRHFRDDVYMAARLAQHVASLTNSTVDRLVMHISSMHVFSAERGRLETDLEVFRYKESSFGNY